MKREPIELCEGVYLLSRTHTFHDPFGTFLIGLMWLLGTAGFAGFGYALWLTYNL